MRDFKAMANQWPQRQSIGPALYAGIVLLAIVSGTAGRYCAVQSRAADIARDNVRMVADVDGFVSLEEQARCADEFAKHSADKEYWHYRTFVFLWASAGIFIGSVVAGDFSKSCWIACASIWICGLLMCLAAHPLASRP